MKYFDIFNNDLVKKLKFLASSAYINIKYDQQNFDEINECKSYNTKLCDKIN